MIAAFARLAARRCAPPRTLAILALSALALAWSTRSSPLGLDLGARDALARRELWSTFTLLSAALLAHAAASLSYDWRRRDADAFGGAPRARAAVALASWLGAWCAACALGVAAALVSEARPAGPSLAREVGRSALAASALAQDELRLRAELSAPRAARSVELELGLVPTDVFAEVELCARRGAESRCVGRRLSARSTVRVELPPGEGRIELTLRRRAGGALVFLARDQAVWFGSAIPARWVSALVWLHYALALAALLALAFALGTRLPPVLAAASALSLALPAWLGEHELWSALAPGGGLFAALEAVGRGAAPAPPSAEQCVSSLALTALALALAARGLESWRTTR